MIQSINISELKPNEGQIPGLPANPRRINDERFEKLKKSLIDDPEMLSLRELLVYKFGNHYIIIGGNMRYNAAVALGIKTLPCKVIPNDTPVAKLKAYTMKDNVAYGEFDWDMLANEWDDNELLDWGVELTTFNQGEVDDFFQQDHNSGGKESKNKIILEYTEDGCERVKDALSKIAATSEEAVWLLLKLDK